MAFAKTDGDFKNVKKKKPSVYKDGNVLSSTLIVFLLFPEWFNSQNLLPYHI